MNVLRLNFSSFIALAHRLIRGRDDEMKRRMIFENEKSYDKISIDDVAKESFYILTILSSRARLLLSCIVSVVFLVQFVL